MSSNTPREINLSEVQVGQYLIAWLPGKGEEGDRAVCTGVVRTTEPDGFELESGPGGDQFGSSAWYDVPEDARIVLLEEPKPKPCSDAELAQKWRALCEGFNLPEDSKVWEVEFVVINQSVDFQLSEKWGELCSALGILDDKKATLSEVLERASKPSRASAPQDPPTGDDRLIRVYAIDGEELDEPIDSVLDSDGDYGSVRGYELVYPERSPINGSVRLYGHVEAHQITRWSPLGVLEVEK